jgi:adenylate cyclase
VESLTNWILAEGRFAAELAGFANALFARWRTEGFPVERASLSLMAIHPQIRASNLYWRPGEGASEVARSHEISGTEVYLRSPIKRIHDGEAFIRAGLEAGSGALEFPVLAELRDQGYSDYAAFALTFGDGTRNVLTLATRRSGGFAARELQEMQILAPLLAMSFEIFTARRTAVALLDTYVGHRAGAQILRGAIQRGHGERIRAVIWFSDMRNFTALSDLRPTDEVIAALNAFYDALSGPIEEHGGQILKFLGDGVLAIFPVDDAAFDHITCRRALEAALATLDAMAKLNRRRAATSLPRLAHNVALHLGDIVYGNVGAAARLDFTAIGPAVNLTARLEALAASLNVPIVLSEAFAALAAESQRLVSLGRHSLKGVMAAPEIFTLAALVEPEHSRSAQPQPALTPIAQR